MPAEGETAVQYGRHAAQPAEDKAEQRLIQACLDGDTAAFDGLVDRHGAKVASVVLRFLGDQNEVDDVVQETFVRAYQNLGRYRGEASVRSWLLRIAINCCKDRRGGFWRRRVWVGLSVSYDQNTDTASSGHHESPERMFLQGEYMMEIQSALQSLPEKYRLPIILHFFEDMTGAEIAATLGWNESTVWSRIYAGFRRLRKSLSVISLEEDVTD